MARESCDRDRRFKFAGASFPFASAYFAACRHARIDGRSRIDRKLLLDPSSLFYRGDGAFVDAVSCKQTGKRASERASTHACRVGVVWLISGVAYSRALSLSLSCSFVFRIFSTVISCALSLELSRILPSAPPPSSDVRIDQRP